MLTPRLEIWRSRLQGGDPNFPEIPADRFYAAMLEELNDISNLLERIPFAANLEAVQEALEATLKRQKPTGMAPDPAVCSRCGKAFP